MSKPPFAQPSKRRAEPGSCLDTTRQPSSTYQHRLSARRPTRGDRTVGRVWPAYPATRGLRYAMTTGSADKPSLSRLPWRPGYCCPMAQPRTVTLPVVVERDEDGVWCAHAQLRPGVGAHGEGNTEEEALEDLREALIGLIEEFGVPRELSVTLAA